MRVNNLVVRTVGGGTNIQSKLTFSDINRNRRRAKPRSPSAGVATGLLKTPGTA